MTEVAPTKQRISTGLQPLDEVLDGGLLAQRAFHIRGGPGCGKTTLGLHFLTAEPGASAVHVTFGERPEQLRADLSQFAEQLDPIEILDLSPDPEALKGQAVYDLFNSEEVEADPVFKQIREVAERVQPRRVFIDSLTQLRYLTPDAAQFRAQVLGLIRAFTDQGATVLFSSEASVEAPDADLQFLSDGVINLDVEEGGTRTLQVRKFRGSGFQAGRHEVILGPDGMTVLPQLVPSQHMVSFETQVINSGIPGIDRLMGGGVHRGTTTLLAGPSGSGKTTLGMQFMKEAAGRGESSAIFLFEEDPETLLYRADSLNMPLRSMHERGMLYMERIEPLHYTPMQLAHAIRRQVVRMDLRIVMLDSAAGYRLALNGGNPVLQLHTLTQYLKNVGVTVFLVNEVDAEASGALQASKFDISALMDNVILLNLVLDERQRLNKQIRVVKRRTGAFDNRAAYMVFTPEGITVPSIEAGPGSPSG